MGATLIEPEGRRVRLTPAGRRLADHAVTILAAVDAARLDLDRMPSPRGRYASGIRHGHPSIVAADPHGTVRRHPGVDVVISEYEPVEAFAQLADDDSISR